MGKKLIKDNEQSSKTGITPVRNNEGRVKEKPQEFSWSSENNIVGVWESKQLLHPELE